ncbi:MAG: hypothetical protein CPDRYMAC_7098 [uncultured Paraburkholderia sp.]|nr:MAG: hypothetical protein CPDRYDRY_7068 [uncultured Paraburkholderia sp.]CAH2945960.1 MAG: hypothetical protein CPDRYMAC_7098 [uncultured Paraburkholderia sp.]
MENGVTTFFIEPEDNDKYAWCENILEVVDQHHNDHAHNPGYTVIEAYGIPFTERLRPAFAEYGFTSFEQTAYGFRKQAVTNHATHPTH